MVIGLDIELWDLWGNLMESSAAEVRYLHGGYENIFPAVEAALEGKAVGDKVEVRLEPQDAFGEYDEELIRVETRAAFPEELAVGMQLEGVPGDDSDDSIYTVTDIADNAVVLDGNHPFAGIALEFRCTVRSIRAATADEIEGGHADDPDAGVIRIH